MKSVVSDLKPIIAGEVSSAADDLAAVSRDFGGVAYKQPQVVVRPQSSSDVAQVVKYAAAQGLTIASRAAGHSLNGQALSEGGILLDMRSLNQLHELQADHLWFKADAGATWQQIVEASLPAGVVPPVLTNNLDVTLGGTHSAAGLGQNSFRYGSQADNCLGLEVVTATGDVVWCSPTENSELFNHVLCGFGQFGIITQVQHRLRKYRSRTRTYFLCYDDLDLALQDQRSLVQAEQVDALLTLFSPCVLGFSRAGGGIRPLIQWFYRIQATFEFESEDEIKEDAFFADLNFYRHIHTEDLAFTQYVQPLMQVPHPVETANPWLDVLLPASAAKEFFETALNLVPSFIDFRTTPMGSFSLLSRNTHMPMFSLPQAELILAFGMYPTVPKARLEPVLKQLDHLTEVGFQKGGKRYLVSWVDFERAQWQKQFGEYWPQVNAMKQKYDPQGLFNPGFIQYEAAIAANFNQPLPLAVSADPLPAAAPQAAIANTANRGKLPAKAIALTTVLMILLFLILGEFSFDFAFLGGTP
ncbi:FAD-binding protein [Almyronema epifaneia]|uniref:FAD-binding protein n=1 Tax=Almyronema epifaneia S1 TaxID=2991925 RepID=A0ABW6IH02_9CYAN